jgi:hypothetical protein
MPNEKTAESVRQSVDDFLTAQSQHAPRTHCPHCHAVLLRTDGVFFFEDGEKTWTVSVAVCPNCETLKDAN